MKLSDAFVVFASFVLIGFVIYSSFKNSPESFYRETFNRSISCRETVASKSTNSGNLDYTCGKIPQFSDFNTKSN